MRAGGVSYTGGPPANVRADGARFLPSQDRAVTLPPVRLVLPAALAACGATLGAAAPLGAQTRPPRPAPANARVEALSPGLEATLSAWHSATDGVTTLEGQHRETIVVHSVGEERHRAGRFWYAEPDRGRIDLKPADVSAVKGKSYRGKPAYGVVAGSPETWVCDGRQVTQIDEPAKEARVTELPADQRGEDIINGPLPFLLGVPPETLKARFLIQFFPPMKPANVPTWLNEPSTPADAKSFVWLELMPRRQQDAQNWSKAMVKLSKPDFLPVNVKLIGPAAGGSQPNTETLYAFGNLKPNKRNFLGNFRGDPFKPSLKGYTQIRGNAGPAPAGANVARGPLKPGQKPPEVKAIVPAVVGLPWKAAKGVVTGRKYAPKLVRGTPTDRKTLVGKIEAQSVKPGTQLPPGSPVELRVWTAAVQQTAGTE